MTDNIKTSGLTASEVEASRREHGENLLTPPKKTPMWRLYLEKFQDPIIRILLVAAFISLVLAIIENEYVEVIGIFLAIFLATTIGFWFERDAAKKFDVLTAIGEESPVKVVRDGKVMEIPRKEVVVGDVVIIGVGDEVPADGVLFETTDLQIDESALTGEPIISKFVEVKNDGATYPSNRALRSTMVMNGGGRMVVTAVGDATEIGKVAEKATEMTAVKTPLNMQLDKLAGLISKIGSTIAVLAFFFFLGRDIMANNYWEGYGTLEIVRGVMKYFMMSVTLIVMAVPEGLPMAVTLSLALNMRRMLKSNNLVRKLHACETMGAVTVICTDKTGTLTQNKMQVGEMYQLETQNSSLLNSAIALNSTAELDGEQTIGNPTESALLLWMHREGVDYRTLRRQEDIEWQLPFSTERKFMATIGNVGGKRYLFIKGAPEIVMTYCDIDASTKESIQDRLVGYQNKAMRTLAFACKELGEFSTQHSELDTLNSELNGLTLQAVAAISDPLRKEVPGAVMDCRDAGIDVKIVTGDTANTAKEIARQIGIWHDDTPEEATITGPDFEALSDEEAYKRVAVLKVMSRARPTDKQRLVNLLQQRGEVVAVTGDGTNDAPALNHAHVGLSLGTGTSVAKNASDMTLIDDSFTSIVSAVEWGRSLYKNIQRFVFFQLIVNVAALLLVLFGSLIGTALPLTITQMLWVNLIMDTFAAMALASLPPSKEVMADKPRKQSDFIITKKMAWGIGLIGLMFFAGLMVLLWWYNGNSEVGKNGEMLTDRELTLFFTIFVMLQWWNLLNATSLGSKKWWFSHMNKDLGLLGVLLIIIVGQIVIVECGGAMFRTVHLSFHDWMFAFLITSPVMIIGMLVKGFEKLFIFPRQKK